MTARGAGITGAGVKVGVMDTGIDPTDPALTGKIDWFKSYVGQGGPDGTTEQDNDGHGSDMSDIVAGNPVSNDVYSGTTYSFGGGVAPDVQLYEAQVCSSGASCSAIAQAYTDLAAQGVTIVNESFDGSDITTQTAASMASVNTSMQAAVTAGLLQVIAAGNQGYANVGELAGMPYYYPALQPYIVAAVNVNVGSNNTVNGLWGAGPTKGEPEPSDACGVAAQWCLAAPGFTVGLPHPPDLVDTASVGTSNATAVISGIAALVQQVYPWMTAPELAETLLTTATAIDPATGTIDGAGGVNSTYGWGLVNAASAIHGPTQLLYGDLDAAVPSGTTSTLANGIAGTSGVDLTGTGTLVLSGTNTYTGATSVQAGTLEVDGSITSSVTTAVGGTLDGAGTIAGIVLNNGTVATHYTTTPQALTITGNLTDAAGSNTSIQIGAPLKVSGTAVLAGTLAVVDPVKSYVVSSNETLLQAGTVAQTFDSVTYDTGVFQSLAVNYSATQVTGTITQTPPASAVASMPIATSETKTSAANVTQALAVSNGWYAAGAAGHDDWFRAAGQFMAASSPVQAVASLDSLSGSIYADSRATEFQQAFAIDHALEAHQSGLLQAPRGITAWAEAVGVNGGLQRSGYAGMDYRATGTIGGIDIPIASSFAVGIAGGSVRMWTSGDGLAGTVDARQTFGALYGQWDLPSGWYLYGRLTAANVQAGVTRDLALGDSVTGVVGARADHVQTATLEAGRTIRAGVAKLTPYLALTGVRLQQSGFTEQGSAMALTAPEQAHTTVLGTLGLRYTDAFSIGGHASALTGYAAYRRALTGTELGMRAAFVGVGDSRFLAEGQNLPRSVGTVGADWTLQWSSRWLSFVSVEYSAGGERLHQTEANVGVRFRF